MGYTSIFPAAGYLCLAIESLRQAWELEVETIDVCLRNSDCNAAPIIANSFDVETQARLESTLTCPNFDTT